MQAALLIDEPGWYGGRHRLAACMAVSSVVLFLVLATLEWPASIELPRLIPLELEMTVLQPAEKTEPEAHEQSSPEAQPLPAPAQATAPMAEPAERDTSTELPVVSKTQAEAPAAPVDWYAELERAAAAVGAQTAAELKSMHPEFDELRRIAALRYGTSRTGEAPDLAWDWEVEKDLYGRTLLKRGNSYIVLDDPRPFNRYAFETFEKHMIFFTIPLGKAPPKNLPWVETIRARYEYMREPDELPPLKVTPAATGPQAR